MEAIKLRGSDSGLNLILIDSVFHKVSPDLVSFEMILCKADIPNIYCIGYSKHFKQLFVQMRNDKRYIYTDVPVMLWQKRHDYEKLNTYWNDKIRGLSFSEVEDYVKPLSNEYVLDEYNKLEYFKNITQGLWVTDRPDKVIDTDNVMWQLD